MVLILLACGGLDVPLDLAVALAFGWVMYLGRVLPQVRIDRGGVATAALCLALFLAGSHAFLGWLYAQVRAGSDSGGPTPRRWRPRWTFALVVTILLMFAAGISAAGIAHQAGWLLTSEEAVVNPGGMAARRAQSTNNLKQIGVGLHGYHQAHATFPPGGTFGPQGRPFHGWQAMLLPYVEQQGLYNRINFGIPWDDPRNSPTFQTVLTMYLNPGFRPPSESDAADYALSPYAGNARLLGGDTPRTLESVTDGSSATLMAGEAAGDFRPWGYPANWREPALGVNRSPEGFGGPYPGGANFLFVDGSVRFLKDGIDPQVLRSLSTPAGGETVSADRY